MCGWYPALQVLTVNKSPAYPSKWVNFHTRPLFITISYCIMINNALIIVPGMRAAPDTIVLLDWKDAEVRSLTGFGPVCHLWGSQAAFSPSWLSRVGCFLGTLSETDGNVVCCQTNTIFSPIHFSQKYKTAPGLSLVKRIGHPKIQIQSLFTHFYVVLTHTFFPREISGHFSWNGTLLSLHWKSITPKLWFFTSFNKTL